MPAEASGTRPVPTASEAAARLARSSSIDMDADALRFVSRGRAQGFERLGLRRVRDLLLHVPHRYLDFTRVVPIGLADVGQDATVIARVDKVKVKRPRARMVIVELSLIDDTGVLIATYFRQPWIAEQIHEGSVIAVSGKVSFGYGFKKMSSPFHEVVSQGGEGASHARILPVHHVTEGISAAWMRRIVSAALADVGDIGDWMPAELCASHGLMTLGRALREVHFPESLASAEQARRRLAYDELLLLQLALLTRRRLSLEGAVPVSHVCDGPHLAALRAALPFELTGEQETAVGEILADMAAPRAMRRLLLGDVGTGKTAVAACAVAACADSGTQAALMAPTSVLAAQHAEKLGPLFEKAGIRCALVLGSTPAAERACIAEEVSSGNIDVVIGTTALLSDDIAFKKLSLVAIDEQHRFGTGQRAALRQKGAGADLLSMTATPIPRTLALSFYGDLDCSRIVNRPVAGAGITTQVLASENVDIAYGVIRAAVEAGQQAYVVCPLIDESDDGADMADDAPSTEDAPAKVHSAIAMQKILSEQVFPQMKVGLMTGRLSADEKDAVMEAFRAREIDILVSTTVIEVGVDVPNATVMLVYDSDRFGLATLHQLRGRVGRGSIPGMVYLETSTKKDAPARKRLSALEKSSNGFELAELDLALRREGEVLGYRQSGGATLRVTDLASDADLVEAAHADAVKLEFEDPALEADAHAALAIEMQSRFGAYFEELGRA